MRYFLLFCFASFMGSLFAQTQFQRVTGTKNDDRNYHLTTSKGGHLIATGYTDDVSGNGDDAFLVKFNRLGKVQWALTYGDTGDDYSWDVNVLQNNDILACGYTSSFGTPKSAATLTRTDSNGTVNWLSALYTTNLGIEFYNTHETKTGHILATGLMQTSSNSDDIVLAKFTAKGYFLWLKTIGTKGSDEVMAITETTNGHYLLAGLANDPNGFGSSDFAVVKTDTAGRIIWSNIYGGTKSERLNACVEANGSYYFSGWSSSVGQGENDIVLMKTDTAGKVIWVNAYGSNRSELCFNMIYETESNSIVMAGYTEKFSSTGQTDNRNTLVLKTNADNGNLIWSETFGGSKRDGHWPTGLATNGNDKGYFLLSSTNTFTTGDYDLYLIKTDTSGNGGCNQKNADLKTNKVTGWKGQSFGTLNKPSVIFTKTTISGSKWTLSQTTECCELYVDAGMGDTLCPGDSIELGSYGILGYEYNWYRGANKVGSKPTITVKYGEGNDYSLIASANAPGCKTETANVSVVDDKKPTTNAWMTQICEGDTAIFKLYGNIKSNDWISVGSQAIVDTGYFIRPTTNDTIVWKASTLQGCNFSDTVISVVLEFPTIGLIDTISFCEGDSQFVNPISNYSYKWFNNTMDTGIWIANSGYFKLSSANNQCSTSDSVFSIVNQNPTPNLGPDFDTCWNASNCFTLKTKYNQTYWNGMKTSRDTFCAYAGTDITIMVVDNYGCIGYDSLKFGAIGKYVNLILKDTIKMNANTFKMGVDSGNWSFYNWIGPEIIGADDTDSVVIGATGWYFVAALDADGCGNTDSFYVDLVSSTLNIDNHLFKVYPNPASDIVFIESEYLIRNIRILSTSGKVLQEPKASNKLNIESLSKGIYFIQIETNHGSSIKKLLVE